ncbi:helix-turn-helix domain-containing protein [Luteimonas sp. SDU82]|uniref:helix-turn-helix domain-containing protein n=1 Tax=Luteimonas sp. SDU82 TaxID=3422592 RepID=UPI003EBF813F
MDASLITASTDSLYFFRNLRRRLFINEPPPAADLPDDVRVRVAANLRRLRKLKNLSQEMLAERADFHRTYVSQLERCATNISITGLQRIAEALGVDVIDLLERPS